MPDPLGGSYSSSVTNRLEEGARGSFPKAGRDRRDDQRNERGFPQREISKPRSGISAKWSERSASSSGLLVAADVERSIPVLKIGPEVEQEQVARLSDLRKTRDPFKMAGALEELQEAAACSQNVMPYLIEAVKTKATLGEICTALKEVFGRIGSQWCCEHQKRYWSTVIRQSLAVTTKAVVKTTVDD